MSVVVCNCTGEIQYLRQSEQRSSSSSRDSRGAKLILDVQNCNTKKATSHTYADLKWENTFKNH